MYDLEKKPSQAEKTADKKKAKKKRKGKTRELVECLLVAGVLALGIRTFAFQIFKIPTRSMEPTLIGNEDYGDRVVAAMWYNHGGAFLPLKLAEPDRWQVIVFKHHAYNERTKRDEPTNFIKRLIGLPGERVEIRDGDIWVRGPNDARPTIVSKPERVQEQLWFKLCDLNLSEPWRVPLYWETAGKVELKKGAPALLEATAEGPAALHWISSRPIDNRVIRLTVKTVECPKCKHRFTAAFDTARPMAVCPKCHEGVAWGVRDNGDADELSVALPNSGGDFWLEEKGKKDQEEDPYVHEHGLGSYVSDLRMAVDFENLGRAGRLEIRLTGRAEDYVFSLDLASGLAQLTGPAGRFLPVERAMPVGAGRHHLEVFNVDGAFWARLDGGQVLGPCAYDPSQARAGTRSDAALSVSNGGKVALGNVKLWRDVYYGKAVMHDRMHPLGDKGCYIDLGPKEYFFLGDNQLASQDSRYFGPKKESDLVARGIFVAWPPSRFHLVW